jgi:hypothetical protein
VIHAGSHPRVVARRSVRWMVRGMLVLTMAGTMLVGRAATANALPDVAMACKGTGWIEGSNTSHFTDHFGVAMGGTGTCLSAQGVSTWSFYGRTDDDPATWQPGLRCPFTGPFSMVLQYTVGRNVGSVLMVAMPPAGYPSDVGETPLVLLSPLNQVTPRGVGNLSENIFGQCVTIHYFAEWPYWRGAIALTLGMYA